MTRTIIDAESAKEWPLSKKRLKEITGDIEKLQEIIGNPYTKGRLRKGIVLQGCRAIGQSGWVIYDGELYEVIQKEKTQYEHLCIVERTTSATLESGQELPVRTERVMEWGPQEESSVGLHFDELLLMASGIALKDESESTQMTGGTWWSATGVESGVFFNTRAEGGRIRLSATVRYVPYRIEEDGSLVAVSDKAEFAELYEQDKIASRKETNVAPTVCAAHRPGGDTIVPVMYNGGVGYAILFAGSGRLVFAKEPTFGDTVQIDFLYDANINNLTYSYPK